MTLSQSLSGAPPAALAKPLRRLAQILEPLGLLGLRLGIGLVFWKSASTRFDGFGISDSAVFLFQEIYRVPLLPPELAAWAGTLAEAGGAWLLFLGLGTRFGALILLGVTAMIQLVVPFTGDGINFNAVEFFLWGGALLVLLVRGGGLVSVDGLAGFFLRRR
ncbi:DoxX family protein [Zavarzinia compransoris]|uniref:DoxX family protein n=1 Tax=Zavarzinia marina TaxID=2911065 RepID=UPI001F306955|nr:DoxX family protein [Zavarzinia marina]MCF4164972.1 DoxX family protein [Zavarzinia marina]